MLKLNQLSALLRWSRGDIDNAAILAKLDTVTDLPVRNIRKGVLNYSLGEDVCSNRLVDYLNKRS